MPTSIQQVRQSHRVRAYPACTILAPRYARVDPSREERVRITGKFSRRSPGWTSRSRVQRGDEGCQGYDNWPCNRGALPIFSRYIFNINLGSGLLNRVIIAFVRGDGVNDEGRTAFNRCGEYAPSRFPEFFVPDSKEMPPRGPESSVDRSRPWERPPAFKRNRRSFHENCTRDRPRPLFPADKWNWSV